MAKNDVRVTDNPKIIKKELSDGNFRLYLDYYLGRVEQIDTKTGEKTSKVKRKRVKLDLVILGSPRTPIERTQNKKVYELAKQIRNEAEQEFIQQKDGYRLSKYDQIDFFRYFQNYINHYTKKDIRCIELAYNRFKKFLKDTPEYNSYIYSIKPEQITSDMIEAFVDYLKHISKGEGAKTTYKRFKKVIKQAIKDGYFKTNPCEGITINIDDNVLRKDILSEDEIIKLINTDYSTLNQEVKRAFIFCLYTGMRFCDVKTLKYNNIDYSNKILTFNQNKTKENSSHSNVITPLNDGLIKLIGEPDSNNNDELIFILPSHTECLKVLKKWTEKADINKHITWHCARHSFATNILNNGANIKVVADLLGHSSLQYTEKYIRAVDKLKEQAINSLPELKI